MKSRAASKKRNRSGLACLRAGMRSDRVCVDAFRQLRLLLMNSEALLMELFHLVDDSRHEMEAAWRFIRSGQSGRQSLRIRNCAKLKS